VLARVSLLLASLALALSFSSWAFDLSAPMSTVGEINFNRAQENIQNTMCLNGYSKTTRPHTHFTNNLKKRQLCEYSYIDTNPKYYEEVHLIPPTFGGNLNTPRKLWPKLQIIAWDAGKKDQLKFVTYRMVCVQDISLAEIRHAMAANLVEAWKKLCIMRVSFLLSK
jgi:hypothetical protein